MTTANNEIRLEAKKQNVKLWEVAEALGVFDGTLSRKLRRELPEKEKTEIMRIISDIHEKRIKNEKEGE